MTLKYLSFLFCFFSFEIVETYAQNQAAVARVQPEAYFSAEEPGQAVKVHQLDHLMRQLYDENQFNGSVAVIEKGNIIYHRAFGWANVANRDTLSIHTPFRLASVSKQFTAMAIMMLKEEGKLSYEDPITKYLPELPNRQVRIRNLLHHNSGIPDYFGIGSSITAFFPKDKLILNEDLVKYFAVKKPGLHFKPGQKSSYSNTGYAFLASIVEKVSGKRYPDFLRDRIFRPLEMHNAFVYTTNDVDTLVTTDTLVSKPDTTLLGFDEIQIEQHLTLRTRIKTVEKKRAYGYQLSYPYPKGYQLFDYHAFDGIAGEKGVCISTYDMAKWDQALYENRLVSEATLAEAFKPSPVYDRKQYYYGYGWKIYRKTPHIVFHHGLYRGFRNYFQRDLKNQRSIVILSNRRLGGKMVPIMEAVNAIMEGKKVKIPSPTRTEKSTLSEFKRSYRITY